LTAQTRNLAGWRNKRVLEIYFSGWFQCRLATNPDPSDEPRGISGYTFALAGEPDLDRIIRLQNPVAPRSNGPEVGVFVRSVVLGDPEGSAQTLDGADQHPLIGVAVDWLDGPRFESRNRLLSEDRGGVGIIEPFHLSISGGGVTIQREDILYPEDPDTSFHLLEPPALDRRAPILKEGMMIDPGMVTAATGISDFVGYRAARKKQLEGDLRVATDEDSKAALAKRIRELSITDPHGQHTIALQAVQKRRFELNGPVVIDDADGGLEVECDKSQDWPIEFWMGCWDADALTGYIGGSLKIPTMDKSA